MRTSGRIRKKPKRYADGDADDGRVDGRVDEEVAKVVEVAAAFSSPTTVERASASTQTVVDVDRVDASTSTTTDFLDASEFVEVQTDQTTQTENGDVVIRARDDDDRREREIERLAETETRLTRELIDAFARASEHCAALARSELGRARAERDKAKMLAGI